METLVVMICVVMNSNDYAGNPGKKFLIIFILINLERKIKEHMVFVMKTKTTTLNV